MILGCLAAGIARTATAQDGTVRIYDSALNELADKIEPLQLSGHYKFEVSVNTLLGRASVTICESDWTAEVKQIAFTTTTAQIGVTGQVTARWCNANFSSNLNTTGNAVYNSSQRAIRLTVNPTSIQPVISVFGYQVALPVYINVAPSLTIPPIPVGIGLLSFETTGGTKTVSIAPTNVSLSKRAGYLELQANVNIW
jgi:hypothetical protein